MHKYQTREAEVIAANTPPSAEPYIPEKTDVTFYFGSHSTAEDFQVLKPHLENVDIFVPESAHWSEETIELLSRLSQGDKQALYELGIYYSGDYKEHAWEEYSYLLGSDIRITLTDIDGDDPLSDVIYDFYQQSVGVDRLNDELDVDFEQTLKNVYFGCKREARIETHREDIMARSLGPRLEAIIANDPELQARDRVNVLVQHGTYHTFVYNSLKKAKTEGRLRRVFDVDKPVIFSHADRLTRSIRSGVNLDERRIRELALRSFAWTGLVTGW